MPRRDGNSNIFQRIAVFFLNGVLTSSRKKDGNLMNILYLNIRIRSFFFQ